MDAAVATLKSDKAIIIERDPGAIRSYWSSTEPFGCLAVVEAPIPISEIRSGKALYIDVAFCAREGWRQYEGQRWDGAQSSGAFIAEPRLVDYKSLPYGDMHHRLAAGEKPGTFIGTLSVPGRDDVVWTNQIEFRQAGNHVMARITHTHSGGDTHPSVVTYTCAFG